MTIDIHSILSKNRITRNVLKPKFGYKYCGPYNKLNSQVDYNKTIGQIYKIHDNPKIILKNLKFMSMLRNF